MHKELESHHGGDWISRQSEEILLPDSPKHDWFSRLDLCSSEKKLSPDLREHLFHQIVLTRRNAAGKQKQVCFQPICDQFAQALGFVRCSWKQHGFATSSQNLSCERIRV